MTKKTIKDKILLETTKYVLNRIKIILFMVVLLILVKEHPMVDAFLLVFLLLNVALGILRVIGMPSKIAEEEFKKSHGEFNDFSKRFWEAYQQKANSKRATITFNNDISTSAKLLSINIVQDDEETIKKKYRKLAMKWHPDRFATDTPKNQEIAKKNFQKISAAYDKIKQYKNIN